MQNYLNDNYNLEDPELIGVLDELPIWSAPFGLKLLDTIHYKKNMQVLDIGFGTGFPLIEIALRLGSTCKIYGIDPWKAAINRTMQKIKQYRLHNIEILEGEAEKIPLPEASTDLIVSNNGLNNVNDLNKVIQECSRITKNGAQMVFTFNTNQSMIEFYRVMEDVLEEAGLHNQIDNMKSHIYSKRKPLDEFIVLLRKHGFEISQVSDDRFDYMFTDGTTMLNHYFMKLAFMGGWKSFVPENRQTEIFSKAEIKLNEIADEQGFLTLRIPYTTVDCIRNRKI